MGSAYDIDGLDNRDPELIHLLVRIFKPLFWGYFRPVIRGLERVPEGAGIFVGNHNGAMLMPDLFIFGIALYDRFGVDGLPHGMGHGTGIGLPLLNRLFIPIGAVRGSPHHARDLLAAGGKVLTYPGGELDSMRPFRDRARIIFGKRRGYVRTALEQKVPIIPVVSSGAHETLYILNDGQWMARFLHLDRLFQLKTWPLVLCLPWGLWFGVPPPHLPFRTRVHVEVLEPISFERHGPQAAADDDYVETCHWHVHAVMEATLKKLVAERRKRRKG